MNIGIKGSAYWPTEEMTVGFNGHTLLLKPATRVTEQSVHINLRGISDIEARTLINRFLSILSWCDDQPMECMFGWSGNPMPMAVPRQPRSLGASIGFPFRREIEVSEKGRLALALFREARTVNSLPYEFLGYFKILNIFWGSSPIIVGSRGKW